MESIKIARIAILVLMVVSVVVLALVLTSRFAMPTVEVKLATDLEQYDLSGVKCSVYEVPKDLMEEAQKFDAKNDTVGLHGYLVSMSIPSSSVAISDKSCSFRIKPGPIAIVMIEKWYGWQWVGNVSEDQIIVFTDENRSPGFNVPNFMSRMSLRQGSPSPVRASVDVPG